jgi:WD40 repeat protein
MNKRSSKPAFYIVLFLFALFFTSADNKDEEKMEIHAQIGHDRYINAIAFSPDGKKVISGSADNTLILWDVASGIEMRRFIGHLPGYTTPMVKCVAFSPDGKQVFSAANDFSLKLWDIASGKEIYTISNLPEIVCSIAFSPDGKLAVSTDGNDGAKLWDVTTGKEIKLFKYALYGGSNSKAVFSPDGNYIATTGGMLRLWDVKTGKIVKSYNDYGSSSYSVAFSPDGKYLLFDSDKDMILSDVNTGEIKKIFKGHTEDVTHVAFSSDGTKILSGSNDDTIKLWDVLTGKEIRTFTGFSYAIEDIAFSPNNKYMISASDVIKLWDISSGKVIRTFARNQNNVSSVAFSPDGKFSLSGNWDKTMKLWNLVNCTIKTFEGNSIGTSLVHFFPDGKRAVSGGGNERFALWDLVTGKEIESYDGLNMAMADTSLDISPNGKQFLIPYRNGFNLYEFSKDKLIGVKGFSVSGKVVDVAFSPDGKYAVSVDNVLEDNNVYSYHMVRLWDMNKFTLLKEIKFSDYVLSVAISPDDKFVLIGNKRDVSIWGIAEGRVVMNMEGHTGNVNSVAYSSDGKKALSGSDDGTLKLWDIKTGKEIKNMSGHSGVVNSVAFSTDGKYALSGSKDGTMRLWNIQTDDWVTFTANTNGTEWLIFNSDGYWDSSPNGGELVGMVRGMECWNIDQFAAKNNRPDLIMKKLPNPDPGLITYYYNQYVKRLRKLGLTEEQLSTDYYVPTANIIDIRQNDKIASIKFELKDAKYKLKRYNIYVNDVPLFGSYGRELTGNNLALTENIELTSGENKIEISCMNENGAESYRALTYATYDKPVKGDLYYIGFGVSKYRDSSLNLNYADKDANDLAETYKKMAGKYDKIYTYAFTNEQCTVDNIKKAKDLLKNAKPDDTFVLFIAGHGVHDTDIEATFYFLTYEVDIKNLPTTAANFELIEDILQGIPPRNKLFLMDTCESGEIEDNIQDNYYAVAESRGFKSRAIGRGLQVKGKATTNIVKRTYLFDKDRYIYNDLARRSGAIVFSACKGGEFSYENAALENGFFTEKIIEALDKKSADKNNDGIISVDELREYVSREVAKLTSDGKYPEGLQHPTVDRDNIYQKFGF